MDSAASYARFDTTSWSLVLAAGATAPQAHDALTALCRAYWQPLYAFLRRQGTPEHDAKDLVQGFFLHLLASRTFTRADPTRGRFRSYLIGALKHFVADENARRNAAKRGGDTPTFSLDDRSAEPRLLEPACAALGPEALYERQWALAVIEISLARVESLYRERDRLALYHTLRPSLTGELAAPRLDAVAREHGLTVGAVKTAAHRLRQEFQTELRREIARTVATPADVAGELLHLRAVLSR